MSAFLIFFACEQKECPAAGDKKICTIVEKMTMVLFV